MVALAAAALLAAPAGANVRDFRPGVTESFDLTARDVAGMGVANVRVLRTNFSWVKIESGTPPDGARCDTATNTMPGVTYDWTETNRMVRRASAHGVSLLPVIVGSPNYVARRSTHSPNTRERLEVEAYKCFVQALVAQYGEAGEYSSRPGIKPVTQWQVWNEPNLIKFSTEELKVNPREYANLVRLTDNQIAAEDPTATVALAGLPVVAGGASPEEYLRDLYRVRGIERSFDVVALHPYARNHRGVEGAVLRVREMLRKVGDPGRYLWITETGWATQGSSFEFLVKDRRGQAKQLRRTYEMLKKNRREWNIGTVTWFRWRDEAYRSQNRGAFSYTGLFTLAGNPKPSCERFVNFTNGRCSSLG